MKLEADYITNVNAASLLKAGETAIGGGDSSFDLSGAQRCDSAAVALLLEWQRIARAKGLQLQLRGIPASLRSLAKLYGVDSLIPVAS